MKTASQLFNFNGEEENSNNDLQESKTTENIERAGTEASPAAFTTTTTATTTAVTAGKRIDYNDDYYYDDSEDRPYRADVIDAAKPMAVRYL